MRYTPHPYTSTANAMTNREELERMLALLRTPEAEWPPNTWLPVQEVLRAILEHILTPIEQ